MEESKNKCIGCIFNGSCIIQRNFEKGVLTKSNSNHKSINSVMNQNTINMYNGLCDKCDNFFKKESYDKENKDKESE